MTASSMASVRFFHKTFKLHFSHIVALKKRERSKEIEQEMLDISYCAYCFDGTCSHSNASGSLRPKP
jgi:hypothetical protein